MTDPHGREVQVNGEAHSAAGGGQVIDIATARASEPEPVRNRQTRAEHAERINEAWRKSVDGIREACLRIAEARQELERAEFNDMIAVDLLMAKSTASRLYQITLNPVLMDVSYMKRLPASWGTWYKLSKLKPERLRSFIEDGKVNPDMEQWQAEALVKSEPDYRPLKKRRTASQHRSDPAASAGSSDSVDDEDTESNTGEDTAAATEPDAGQIALAGEDALDTLKEALARTRIPIEDVRLHGDVTTCAMVAHELIEHVLAILTLGEELAARATDSQPDVEPSGEQGSRSDVEPLPTLTATQQEHVQAACATLGLQARDRFLLDLTSALARCQQPITDEDLGIAIDGLLVPSAEQGE